MYQYLLSTELFINVIIRPLEYTATCFGPHFRHIHSNILQKVKINTSKIGLKKDLNVSRNILPYTLRI